MKRIVLIAAALLAGVFASAQMSADYYKSQYERQVKVLGPAGVGVETILDNWEAAAPDDGDMLEGRFVYYFNKARSSEVVKKSAKKYLGQKPVLEMKDSLGVPVYFFQVENFEDSLFAKSQNAIDRAIALYPDELKYRVDKITALVSYEGESPDMACAELMKIIDRNVSEHPSWTYDKEPADDDLFQNLVQEYCFTFFNLGTPSSYEAFNVVSSRMAKLYPKNSVYVSNMGTYWLIAKENQKKAQTYYKKALKLDPDDYAATRNMKIIQLSQSRKDQSSR